MTVIAGVSRGFPPYYYQQEEILSLMQAIWADSPVNLSLLKRFFRNAGIQGRHLALPLETYRNPSGFGERNSAWTKAALELAEKVTCDLLDHSGIPAAGISLFASTTVTGIAVPSLEARLMNRIPFGHDLKRVPLFGWGCMGGAAGVARVADYLQGHPQEAAILLALELCSLTIQHDDYTAANMVSSSLFGDGAAAVLLLGDHHPNVRSGMARVVDSRSVFFPQTEHIMGWEMRDSGFKMLLSADVAEVAGEHIRPEMEDFLSQHGLSIADIEHWVVHPGGPKVIQEMEKGLGLDEGTLRLTRQSLAKVGNVSSVSVLLILADLLDAIDPQAGSYGIMMAMGPAFSAEIVLLQW